MRWNDWLLIPIALTIAASSSIYAALPNKTLVYCSESSPTGFDPNRLRTIADYTASAVTLYNRLIEIKRGDIKQIEPSLAENWNISEDGRVYTFHLRRGVKFHDTPWFKPTRELQAEDVIWTFERIRNPNMPFRKGYSVEFPDFYNTGLSKVSKIEALDPYTVRFTLKTAHAPFLSELAMPSASILPAEYAAQLLKAGTPAKINQEPSGTGPYIFRHYIKDATIRFDGNPNYWKPEDVQLSKLIFSITPNAAVRVQKLKRNECQIISNPPLSEIALLESDPNLQVLSQPGFNINYLAYNTTHQPLNDVRVRRALDMALDKKAIIEAVYEGHAQIAVAPMPPLQWSYDETLQDAPRDLKKSKTLLTQAGYPNGFTISLWTPPRLQTNPNPKLTAEMIQADWAKIGVKAKIVTYELGETIKRAINGEHDALLIGWSSVIYDPDNWLNVLKSEEIRGNNFSKWRNKSFDDLIQRAAQTMNMTKRAQLYKQAQKIFKREQPLTSIAYQTRYQAINRLVTHFKINPLNTTLFYGVGLSD